LIGVGTELNKASHNVKVALFSCDVQGRGSLVQSSVKVCAKVVSKAVDYIQPAFFGGHVQWRLSICICMVDVGTKIIQQAPQNFQVPLSECATNSSLRSFGLHRLQNPGVR
jgi:hypothetical protein